jgi:glycosyltransferase involved in cell wall biosynthesis
MKIAFLGNMNNHFFATVRTLRAAGVDAELIYDENEADHFHPSADTFRRDYIEYSRPVGWGDPRRFSLVSNAEVRGVLSRYDKLVVSGSGIAFAHRAGRTADIFVPYGADLVELPFWAPYVPRRRGLLSMLSFPFHQREGIRDAHVIGGATAEQFERVIKQLRTRGKRIPFPVAPVDSMEFSPQNLESIYARSAWYHLFKSIRDSADVVLFHHTRHLWTSTSTTIAHKGNDKLLRAFARLREDYPDVRFKLICCEYGLDFEASKALLRRLGAADDAIFLPLLPRKELMVGISLADIVCSEFAVSWNFGGTIIEALAMQVPLLNYRDDALYPKDELYPIMNAYSEFDIVKAIGSFVDNPKQHREQANIAHQWFNERIIARAVTQLKTILLGARNA